MARSTYYFEINKTDPVAIRNEELLLVIKKIFVENKGRYGVRRVYMELKNRGYNVNHKRVQRLMHDAGLFGKRPKEKYHSYKGEVGKVADNVTVSYTHLDVYKRQLRGTSAHRTDLRNVFHTSSGQIFCNLRNDHIRLIDLDLVSDTKF